MGRIRQHSIVAILIALICFSGSVYAQEPTKEEKQAQKEAEKQAKEEAKKAEKDKKAFEKEQAKTAKEEAAKAEAEATEEGGGGDKASTSWGVPFDGASIQAGMGFTWYHGDLAPYLVFPKWWRTKYDYDNEETKPYREHFHDAMKASLQREIAYGLGAGFQFQKGNFRSGRQNGKYAEPVSFQTNFYDIALVGTIDLNEVAFKKRKYRRLWFQGFFGWGAAWYRTYQVWDKTGNIRNFYGYQEYNGTQATAQKQLGQKDPRLRTWTFPVGVNMGWRLNYKTDLTASYTFTSTSTDYMDGWFRDWTARDKYSSLVIGIRYNFNRDPEGPYKVNKKPKKEKEDENGEADDSSGTPDRGGILKGLFGGKGNVKPKEEDKLLDLRLKMFETQLKLFEMQYLMQEGEDEK